MRPGYALELDSLLLTELRNARHGFDEGASGHRSLTSSELSALTGEPIERVRARLHEIEDAGDVFEDGVRDRWTSTA